MDIYHGSDDTRHTEVAELSAAEQGQPTEDPIPIVQVAFADEMWLSLPLAMSRRVYEKMLAGENAQYEWLSDNPKKRKRTVNRYEIDWASKTQRNLENGRKRSCRIVWGRQEDVDPVFTGETVVDDREGNGTDGADAVQFCELDAAEHRCGTEEPMLIVEVAYGDDKWWNMPADFSREVYEKMQRGERGNYTSKAGGKRRNYVFDFFAMTQTNIANWRTRFFRFVCARPEEVNARFTGDIA